MSAAVDAGTSVALDVDLNAEVPCTGPRNGTCPLPAVWLATVVHGEDVSVCLSQTVCEKCRRRHLREERRIGMITRCTAHLSPARVVWTPL